MQKNRTYTAKNMAQRYGAAVEFIVLHDTAGNGGLGDVKYLAADPEKRGISVDFAIPKNGEIYQLNPDPSRYSTMHAGRKTSFRGYSGQQVNRHSIGIEIGQKANMAPLDPDFYPDHQIEAVAWLCVDLCGMFALDKTDITTHAKVITDGSRSDPRHFPWNLFWEHFNRWQGLDPRDGTGRVFHTVEKGDTLFGLSLKYLTSVEKIKGLNNMEQMNMTIKVGQKLLVKE